MTAASFVGMWIVMMVPMMLPSLIAMLWRYREVVGNTSKARLNVLTALVSVAYFSVWTVFGIAVFLFGGAASAIEMQQPALAQAMPIAAGVVVLIGGVLQFTAWKARHLACCREASASARMSVGASYGATWRYGVRLALLCVRAAVPPAITAERLAPAGEHVAQAIGAVVVGTGVILIVRAAGLA